MPGARLASVMDIILVPVSGSTPRPGTRLSRPAAGRAPRAGVTLPGMEPKDADRSQITLRDHIDAVVEDGEVPLPDWSKTRFDLRGT